MKYLRRVNDRRRGRGDVEGSNRRRRLFGRGEVVCCGRMLSPAPPGNAPKYG